MATEKQIAANARNAAKSTGPRTEEGKARSRRNGLRHGFAAEVLVPEGDRAKYEAELARWEREAGPSNVVEEHLIRRAAVGSVTLDRIEAAREETREASAREAVADWERRKQAMARRKAQDLQRDPSNTVQDLEATAFGCDWLIRRWQALDAPLRLGKGWDHQGVAGAQRLLGLPEGMPGVDAEPEVRELWRLAAAASSSGGTGGLFTCVRSSTSTLVDKPPGPPSREVPAPTRVEADPEPLDDPALARRALRSFIADRVDRLLSLRDESWEAVEGPERDAVVRRALASDTSKEGQIRHRYEASADRACNAAVRLFLNLRDRRRRELLEFAKEARHYDTPRAPVGGGWWREPDSDPAPPGFCRIDPAPSASASEGKWGQAPAEDARSQSPFPLAGTSRIASENEAPIPIEQAGPDLDPALPKPVAIGDDRPMASPDGPRRSEPNSPRDEPGGTAPNPFRNRDFRDDPWDATSDAPRRTEPLRDPDRPARRPADRPASVAVDPEHRGARGDRSAAADVDRGRGWAPGR